MKEERSGLLMVNMDNGLVIMTGKSQSRTTTSRTISISLTLQAHPLSRMRKVTCWLSTFHLQPSVQRVKNLHLNAPLPSSHHLPWGSAHPPPHRGWPGAPSTTTSQSIHNTRSCSDHWLRRYLPAKCPRWRLNGLRFRISRTSPPSERGHEGGSIWPPRMNSPTVSKGSQKPSGWSELHALLY